MDPPAHATAGQERNNRKGLRGAALPGQPYTDDKKFWAKGLSVKVNR